jgi:hypothetical protein
MIYHASTTIRDLFTSIKVQQQVSRGEVRTDSKTAQDLISHQDPRDVTVTVVLYPSPQHCRVDLD